MNKIDKIIKNISFKPMNLGWKPSENDTLTFKKDACTFYGKGALTQFKRELKKAIQEIYGWQLVENGLPNGTETVLWSDERGNQMIGTTDMLIRDVEGHLRVYGDIPSFVPTKWRRINY